MKAWGTVAPAIGGAGNVVGATGHVPLPKPTSRPGSDIVTRLEAAHARVSPIRQGPKVDPDALERLRRLGVLVEVDTPNDEPRTLMRRPVKTVKVRRPRGPQVPRFDRARIAALYEGGLSAPDVAAQVGCSTATVYAALAQSGVDLRPPGRTAGMPAAALEAQAAAAAERRDRIVAAYRSPDEPTVNEVAERLGFSVSTVSRALREGGVRVRRIPKPLRRQQQAYVDAYLAGESIPEIAHRCFVSVSVVRRAVVASRVPRRDDRSTRSGGRTTVDAATAQQVVDLYEQGKTTRQVGDRLGLSQQTVQRTLRRSGVTVRTPAEAQRGRPGADGARSLKDLMAANGIHSGDVRAWARTTGRPIPDRGLPPKHLVEAYLLLHRKRGDR